MFKAKISDDKDVIAEYIFNNWRLFENEGNLVLELLANDEINCRYLIHKDKREPDINAIQKFITSELENASSGTQAFILSEYLLRDYIYIGSDENRRQFTAQKL